MSSEPKKKGCIHSIDVDLSCVMCTKDTTCGQNHFFFLHEYILIKYISLLKKLISMTSWVEEGKFIDGFLLLERSWRVNY